MDAVGGKLTKKEESLSQISLKSTSQIEMRKNNMSIFGFQDHNKVDEIPNVTLPLIITTTIVNHFISGMLMDDESSFNLIYLRVFTELGLSKQDIEPCEIQSLIAYNDSSTRPYGQIDLLVCLREERNKITMSDCFFVIPYGSVYNDILGRSFLATLYTLAFTAHLKMKYQSVPNKPNIITTDLRRA